MVDGLELRVPGFGFKGLGLMDGSGWHRYHLHQEHEYARGCWDPEHRHRVPWLMVDGFWCMGSGFRV